MPTIPGRSASDFQEVGGEGVGEGGGGGRTAVGRDEGGSRTLTFTRVTEEEVAAAIRWEGGGVGRIFTRLEEEELTVATRYGGGGGQKLGGGGAAASPVLTWHCRAVRKTRRPPPSD